MLCGAINELLNRCHMDTRRGETLDFRRRRLHCRNRVERRRLFDDDHALGNTGIGVLLGRLLLGLAFPGSALFARSTAEIEVESTVENVVLGSRGDVGFALEVHEGIGVRRVVITHAQLGGPRRLRRIFQPCLLGRGRGLALLEIALTGLRSARVMQGLRHEVRRREVLRRDFDVASVLGDRLVCNRLERQAELRRRAELRYLLGFDGLVGFSQRRLLGVRRRLQLRRGL